VLWLLCSAWTRNRKKVLDIIEEESEIMKEQTGIQPSLEQKDVKTYLDSVLLEIQSKKENNQTTKSTSAKGTRPIIL
jgi:hypothetical protein